MNERLRKSLFVFEKACDCSEFIEGRRGETSVRNIRAQLESWHRQCSPERLEEDSVSHQEQTLLRLRAITLKHLPSSRLALAYVCSISLTSNSISKTKCKYGRLSNIRREYAYFKPKWSQDQAKNYRNTGGTMTCQLALYSRIIS